MKSSLFLKIAVGVLIVLIAGLVVKLVTVNLKVQTNVTETTTTVGIPVLARAIGDNYQGGKVAYILQLGDPGYVAGEQHGLIAAPSDQNTSAVWGCSETAISGANGTAIGTGNQNTMDIMNRCSTAKAAKLCGDLTLNGYSDWYLPSLDELNQLYLNKIVIGGFTDTYYWSSNEANANFAWLQYFGDGNQYDYGKGGTAYVRAVRSF